MKYACPCCNAYTYEEEPSGTGFICPVCFWEDDKLQLREPAYAGGANAVSLEEARANYMKLGACEERFVSKVRVALPEEQEDYYESDDSTCD